MLLDRIVEKHYNELNESDLFIWQYIVHHKRECQNMSIHEMAMNCNVSHTSILRFAKKIGLEGFSELKLRLKMDLNQESEFNQRIIDNTYFEVMQTMNMMKSKDLTSILELIHYAKRVYVYPTGAAQKLLAKELRRIFLYSQKLFHIVGVGDAIDTVLYNTTDEDLFIIISLSGDNEEAVNLAKALETMRVMKIAICKDGHTLLSRYCDETICFHTSSFKVGTADLSYDTLVHYHVIGDFLYLKYLEFLETLKE